MGRVLAIDIGQKRIGLAVTDDMRIIATPLETVHVKDIWDFLNDYFDKNDVDIIIAGNPVQNDGSPSDSVRYVIPFIKKIRKIFPDKQTILWDERFTSVMAQDVIRKSGTKRKKRLDKSLVDKVSATILLQSFLQSKYFNQKNLSE